jgi:hypothetical protein
MGDVGAGLHLIPPPGGPPPVPVAPQLPYAADPGSITGWLLQETSVETSSDISFGMERGFNRLTDNIPDVGEPAHDEVMGAMMDEIIDSDSPSMYLTATNILNDVVTVMTVHSIYRYSAGFGGTNALHGKTLALLGEMVDSQLPTLIRFDLEATADLVHALEMEEVIVPSDAQVDAYFNVRTAENLMPAVTVANGGTIMRLCNFCPIVLAWAPYFLDTKRPYEALQMGRELVASLPEAAERTRAAPMLDWLRAACTRLGPAAGDRRLSLVNQNYHATAPDSRVIRWMNNKVSRYRLAEVPGAAGEAYHAPGVIPVLPRGTLDTKGEKNFTALETSKIQACCGLTDAQWEAELPEIYTRMLEEGRTTPKVRALLEDIFRPADTFSLESVHLTVSDDLAKDIKEVNMGFNSDLSYETCHRGISPFTVIGISMATASRRRRAVERINRTTNVTLEEVTLAESTPDPIPMEYHGLTALLRRYVELLKKLVGERCDHYLQVRMIAAELILKPYKFERLTAKQIASLLWQIFTDARRFFSAGLDVRNNLPQSLLSHVHNEVLMGNVTVYLNVPFDELLGHGGDIRGPTFEGAGGGSGPPSRSGAALRGTTPRIYNSVPPAIKTVLTGARSKYPRLTVSELMLAHVPPLQYSQVKLGPNGACLDYLCFGNCKNTGCGYKHPETAAVVTAERATAVAAKLGTAYTAYNAAQG